MNFFKRIFSSKQTEAPLDAIYTEDYFNQRYTEQDLQADPAMLEGCIKMVESYFIDNKIERKVKDPVNHPLNLDQVFTEGMGFEMYCRAFKLGESEMLMFLAYAFSGYLTENFGFKLYKDNTPESPGRSMTLKYDQNGAVLSLYPFEYAHKVLNGDATFDHLYGRLKQQLGNMPDVKETLKDIVDRRRN
ncbi:MAG: hypothetical protein EOP45_14380 [Sphingobacteriaceae bacterium]|nr:MAG: hypothetical protein EOP45_14380 [Sphingobacteriaceae bacterium]